MNDAQKQAKEYAEILLAFSRGHPVEYRLIGGAEWKKPTFGPVWQFAINEYRIAPKPVEVYVWKHDDGEASVATFPDKKTCEMVWGQMRGKPVLMREVTE